MTSSLSEIYPETCPNGLTGPQAAMIVVPNHKLLYCPISKNGSTSLKRLMLSLSDIPHKVDILKADVHLSLWNYKTGLKLMDYDLETALQMISSTEFFKFAVVRDPFARLVSAYLDKFVIHRFDKAAHRRIGPVLAAVQNSDRPDLQRSISFAEFVQYIASRSPEEIDPHWRPQRDFLGNVRCDRLYCMEDLDPLCHDLAARVGHPVTLERLNTTTDRQLPFVHAAANQTAEKLKHPRSINRRSFFEADLMAAIVEYYKDDYQMYAMCGGKPAGDWFACADARNGS